MPASASSVLAEVEADLRRRFGSRASSSATLPAPAFLSLLTSEDWAAVLCPLAPETQYSEHGSLHELVRYVQVRCAELPMRLQIEALQTRRYEHLLRQHTRELVTLSEYVTLVSRAPPTLAGAAAAATTGDSSFSSSPQQLLQSPSTGSALLSNDLQKVLAPAEVSHRLERAEERVRELEAMLRQDAEAKLQCCQRMVLLSEYVHALLRRVQHLVGNKKRAAGATTTTGAKRARTEMGIVEA
jgi:hypothetical protein